MCRVCVLTSGKGAGVEGVDLFAELTCEWMVEVSFVQGIISSVHVRM